MTAPTGIPPAVSRSPATPRSPVHMRPDELEKQWRERLDARSRSPRRTPPRPHAPRLERADRIGEFWAPAEPRLRRALDRLRGGPDAPSVLVGMLRDVDRQAETLVPQASAFASSSSSARSSANPSARAILPAADATRAVPTIGATAARTARIRLSGWEIHPDSLWGLLTRTARPSRSPVTGHAGQRLVADVHDVVEVEEEASNRSASLTTAEAYPPGCGRADRAEHWPDAAARDPIHEER